MKWITGIIVVALLIWGGWALTHRKAAEVAVTPTTTESIKVGVIVPLSGDAAAYGEPARNNYQIAVDEINAAGGVNGQMIELIVEDGKCDSATAASAAQKLVNVDKVQAIIGGFCSSESLAALPVAAAGKVLLFSPGSSSPDLTGKDPFFARNYPSDSSQGSVIAQVAKDMGWKKVAFIQETKDYPLGIFKAFDAKFTALGGKTVKEEFPSESKDFRTSLAKLKAQNPDAVFIDPQVPAAADIIIKQMEDMKWMPHIILNDVAADPALVTAHTKTLEGAVAALFGVDTANARFSALITKYKTKFGVDMPWQTYGQTEYDAPFILAEGIKAVGYNGEKLAAWMRTVKDWEGASGKVTIGADGDLIGGHTAMIVKKGELQKLAAASTTPVQ